MAGFGVDRGDATDGSGAAINGIDVEIIDAKGDLIVGTADDTPSRLAVGANDRILMADSAETPGMKWATPAQVRTAIDVYDTGTVDDALALKAPLASPALTGTPTAPTAAGNTDSTQIATTAFVMAQAGFRKNAIINGCFNIWQRGTSFAAIANGAYSADRWQYGKTGTMVHTLSRSTDVPTVAQAGRLFNYSLLVDCTTADAAIAAGDDCQVLQPIEGYNWLPIAQRAFTLSFWVKATKTGIYCVSFQNSGRDRSYVAEYTISAADTWEKKTINVSASPSAGTWDYETGVGLRVEFILASGSTFNTTAGSWQTGDFRSTANQVNACDDAANNFRIAGVQLESGSVATTFEQRHFQDELGLCQRYYTKSYNYGVAPGATTTVNAMALVTANATNGEHSVQLFPVTMRATPTLTYYSTQSGTSGKVFNATTAADVNSVGSSLLGDRGYAGFGAAVAAGSLIMWHHTASAEL